MNTLHWISLLVLVTLLAGCSAGTPPAPTEVVGSPGPTREPTQQVTQEPTGTPEPSPTPVLEGPFSLERVGDQVQAYPGPLHYAGDLLTFEVRVEGFREPPEVDVSLTLDGGNPIKVPGQWTFNKLLIPLALDTTGLEGTYEVKIEAPGQPSVDTLYRFEVLPADQRPQQETGADWESIQVPCCTIHYITDTAAARDLETIADHAQQAAEDFAQVTGVEVQDQLDIYIMDRMWGNGAFAGGDELLMAYTDRYYGPSQSGTGIETIFRHEFTHATGVDSSEAGFFPFNEGLAVYIAGGHYKPEPIPERGAAMLELGYEAGLDIFSPQHEVAYLHGATIMAYIVEKYGWEALREFGRNAAGDSFYDPEQRDQVMQEVFGVSSETFDKDYLAWLESHDPGEQLDDLRLTIDLQDLRREYQAEYAPPPFSIFGRSEETYARPEFIPLLIREANAPPNIAVELMIANAQKAIVDGDYTTAETLIDAIRGVLESSEFTSPLAYEYASVVLALNEAGYECLSLDLQGNEATAQVTSAAPTVETVMLQSVDGRWQVGP